MKRPIVKVFSDEDILQDIYYAFHVQTRGNLLEKCLCNPKILVLYSVARQK